jgi:hypothetical protein
MQRLNNIRLTPVDIQEIRPTQMTVGFLEIDYRINKWKKMNKLTDKNFLEKHVIPVVIGPNKKYYAVDQHHLTSALIKCNIDKVYITIMSNLKCLNEEEFWRYCDRKGWCHTFDENGNRREYKDIPKKMKDLKDDPYRSLAGQLRRIGGYAKDQTCFSEFIIADYFRNRIDKKLLSVDFDSALKVAYTMMRSEECKFLPGWCGFKD